MHTSQSEEIRLELGALSVAAKRWGRVGGKRILALHGWLDNAASFDRLAPLLLDLDVDLVALDLVGHGRSMHRPQEAAYHFVEWTVDVDRVLDALGWERAILMGHSLGAAISSIFAGGRPERVERLVLIDGLGPLTDTEGDAPSRLREHLLERSRGRRRGPTCFPSAQVAAERLCQVVDGMGLESARLIVGRGTEPCETGVRWSSDPRLRGRSAWRLTEGQVRAFLASIRAPSVLFLATNGYPWGDELMRERAASIDGLELLEVEGGHHLHLETPERIVDDLRRFLQA